MINVDIRGYIEILLFELSRVDYIYKDTLKVVVKSKDIDDFKIHMFVFSIQMITKHSFFNKNKTCIVC